MDDQATSQDSEQIVISSTGPARRRLGRGLSALLGGGGAVEREGNSADAEPNLPQIDVELIERNPYQPRRDFDPETLAELVESIGQHGVLQPLLVRCHAGGYQLIAGERRWLAGKKAGLKTIPCRILELEDRRVFEVAIEENLKRKDLNVLEKAQAFQDYLDRFDSSIEELARQLSMNRSTLSNYLRLLELPDVVKQSLRTDAISNGHARALLPLGEADQIALCRRIESESLSVRKTEAAVRALLKKTDDESGGPEATPSEPGASATRAEAVLFAADGSQTSAPQPSNHVQSLARQLQELLGTKVEIRLKREEAGKIVIDFHSNDQFEHIVRRLRQAA